MKFHKIVIVTAITAVLSSVSVFATPKATETPKTDTTQQKNHCEQKRGSEINKDRAKEKGSDTQIDPIERLKKKKAKVKELYDAGKITKEEADDLNAK